MPPTDHPSLRESVWAMRPEAFAAVERILSGELSGRFRERAIELLGHEPTAEELEGALAPTSLEAKRGEIEVVENVAILRLYGMITPFGSFISLLFGGGSGGLQAFREDLAAADNDESVGAILIDVDSPGGLADLVPETAAEIRASSTPTVAVANTEAGSAAYWLASQANQLAITPSGHAGSIGVFARHIDQSRALDAEGIAVTLISAGKYKTEGNPFEPLSEEAEAAIQDRVDKVYKAFVGDVAKGRGATPTAVRSGYGEGRMLLARDAVSEGIADRVETFEAAFARASKMRSRNGESAAGGGREHPGVGHEAHGVEAPADGTEVELEGDGTEPAQPLETDPPPRAEAEPGAADPETEPESVEQPSEGNQPEGRDEEAKPSTRARPLVLPSRTERGVLPPRRRKQSCLP